MANSRNKILLVIPGLTAGGAERVLVLLTEGLLAQGYGVDVVTVFGRQHDFYPLPKGVQRIALDLGGDTSRVVDKLAGNLRRITGLRRAIRAAAPDVVISFLSETNVLVLLATVGLGIPVIVTEHIDSRCYPLGRAWKTLRRLSYRRAARLVSASAGIDMGFSWLPAGRRVVIHNPVCLDGSDAAVSAPRRFPRPHTVLAMGRLETQKGFDLLIDAFGRLAADFPDWGLVILGEGSLRPKLSAQIEALGLGDRIHMPGVTASPAATLRRGDLFVLSSRYEGFGLALVEAMAVGLPVVAADCPSGPAEIVHPGEDGLLVPAENVSALAGAMAQLMSDPAERRRLGENARAVAQRFGLNTVMQSWEQVIDACLGQGRAFLSSGIRTRRSP
jgi:glycosyltransferase involved in cell wall biosynthesis